VQQKYRDRKIVVVVLWQQNYGRKTLQEAKIYGFDICSVEFLNLVEGFPCKYIVFPLGSLGFVVDLI